jgi:hypothetical protein
MLVTNKLLSTPVTQEEVLLNERLAELGEPSQAKATQPKAPKPPKQLKTVENLIKKVGRSKTGTELNASIGQLITQTRNVEDAFRLLKAVYGSLTVGTLKPILYSFTTEEVTRLPEFLTGTKINNLDVINDAVQDMAGMRTKMIRKLAENLEGWTVFNNKYPKGGEILADLINAATLVQVDPAKHPDAATAIKNDPKLKRIENDILNPSTDPKSLPRLKGERSKRTAEIKVMYEGGTYSNPVTGEKYTLGGWDQLGKIGKGKGHDIYRMARDSYKQTFDLHEKLLKEKIASSNVPGDINDASTPKGKLIAAITKTFQEARLLDIYFPLMRYGNFWFSKGKGVNSEFYMFENATARNVAVEARIVEINKASGTNRSLAKIIEDGDIDVGDDIRKLREKHVESSDMLKEIFEMLDSNKMTDIDAVKDNIYQMYLMTLPDKDIRRKFVHRQGKTGFSADAIRNFMTSQHTAANQLARLSYADKIRNGIAAAYAEIAQNPDKLKLAAFIREISIRALSEITPRVPGEDINWDQLASVANKAVFYYLLTSPKSAIVQMTQLPTVGIPVLVANFGTVDTMKTIFRYSALWNKFGVPTKDPDTLNVFAKWGQPSIEDSSYVTKHKDPAYREVLKKAWNFANDRDIFMSTYAGDITSRASVPSTEYQNVAARTTRFALNFISGAFHHAERISRELMYMSAFELSYAENKKKGMNDADAFDSAAKRALKINNEVLFDYTQYNKPRLFKNPGGRFAFQFFTFPLMYTSFMVRNFYKMLPLLNKEEKKLAAIKFFGSLFMTFNLAGMTGLPTYSLFWGLVEGIREAMRPGMDDEDEDEEPYDPFYDQHVFGYDTGNPLRARDLDLWFRAWFIPHYFGPKSDLADYLGLTKEQALTLARAVELGPISAYTDLNINTSVSLDGLWFRNDTPAKDEVDAVENMLIGMTGATGSALGSVAAGVRDWNNGQVDRAYEKLAPFAFFKGAFKANRFATQGAKTPQGDVLRNQEFFTTGKLFAQALGFGSTELDQLQKHNMMAKQQAIQIENEKKKLLNRFNVAVDDEQKDSKKYEENINKVLKDILKYNKKNGVIDAIEDETLDNSLKARADRRGESYEGLSVSKKYQDIIYPLVQEAR